MSNAFLLPVISEKSMRMAEVKEYTFLVDSSLTKHQIRKAVEDIFGVTVQRVRTKTLRGKLKKAGRKRLSVKTADRKLAIVRVGKDDKIDLFETKKEAKSPLRQSASEASKKPAFAKASAGRQKAKNKKG
ncbi:MAG: 50S ribosomal protein L23 [Candidatus Blackburnbacteria bacterium]|nr:50S ribosomal protein L23 [Candidatus Blackburnbacteria bacterium]